MALSFSPRQKQLQSLVQKLGLGANVQVNWHLLDLAMTHPTFSAQENYEQLEFIGDSVVRLAVSQLLWETYPSHSEGDFTAMRSFLVNDRTLAEIASIYNLGRYLLVSPNTVRDQTGEETRLAEAFEAMLGALYLSSNNLTLIRPWLDPHISQRAAEIMKDPARQNYKAALQEWTQGYFKTLPEYKVTDEGQIYGSMERYRAQVWFQGKLLGNGKGRSMKLAEQAAAKEAFLSLQSFEFDQDFD